MFKFISIKINNFNNQLEIKIYYLEIFIIINSKNTFTKCVFSALSSFFLNLEQKIQNYYYQKILKKCTNDTTCIYSTVFCTLVYFAIHTLLSVTILQDLYYSYSDKFSKLKISTTQYSILPVAKGLMMTSLVIQKSFKKF